MAGKCSKCGQNLTFRNTALSNPPSCVRCLNLANLNHDSSEIGVEKPESKADFSIEGESMSNSSASTDKLLSHEARIAIESARIVNVYGSFIQVVGIILGILSAGGGFWLSSELYTSVYKVIGIISGLAVIAISAIQGALFRMLANYVVARLKD